MAMHAYLSPEKKTRVNGGGSWGGMMAANPAIEIADMDGDSIPDIVLRAPRELIVLENNLDFKSTITLPAIQ